MANEYSVKRLKVPGRYQVNRFFKGGFTNSTVTMMSSPKGDQCVCTCTSYQNTLMPCNHIRIAYQFKADPSHASYRLRSGA